MRYRLIIIIKIIIIIIIMILNGNCNLDRGKPKLNMEHVAQLFGTKS